MNTIVLGTDHAGECEAAVRLLTRLRFTDATIDTVHAIELPPYMFDSMYAPISQDAIAEAMRADEQAATTLGERIAARLSAAGITPGARVAPFGAASRQLIEHADNVHASLIAIGSGQKGPIRSLVTGSVSRALVTHAHQSVLVAKGDPAPEGPIRAVFATDHSEYAQRCVPELLRLAPQGLSHLTVMTSYPKETARVIGSFLPDLALNPSEVIDRELCERNAQTLRALAPLDCGLDAQVVDAEPGVAIPQVMKQTGADLLILGAQGHGFFDRLTLGSTSFQQVVAEPYPVLVLRVPQQSQT